MNKDIADENVMPQLLEYWELLSAGPNSVDIKNPNQVMEVQQVLSSSGYYDGAINGNYTAIVDQARWEWIKDIQQDPDFAWGLIKKNVASIFEKKEG